MAFASFDRKTSSQPMAEINMVPLIDVVLVLLVIFIVTAPLLTNTVKLDLPKASSNVDVQKPEKVEFAIDATGSALPDSTTATCKAADAVLLGAVGGPKWDDPTAKVRPEQGLLAIRKALGLYANLRPVAPHASLVDASPLRPERLKGVDLLVVRELTGGIYFGEKGLDRLADGGERARDVCTYDTEEVTRIVRMAGELARGRRGKVTSVDKANVLETSRLWRAVVSDVAKSYPDVELEHVYVDTAAMRLATSPTSFDVMLCDNLFGDILSDQAASIAGSLGVLPSATIGGKVDLYEPVHGSAPDIAGKGLANPIGAIASAAMLLRFSAKMEKEAAEIEHAIEDALASGARTKDLAGPGDRVLSTREMGQAIEDALHEVRDRRHSYHAV